MLFYITTCLPSPFLYMTTTANGCDHQLTQGGKAGHEASAENGNARQVGRQIFRKVAGQIFKFILPRNFAAHCEQGHWTIWMCRLCPTGPQTLWRQDQEVWDELGRGARLRHGEGAGRRHQLKAMDGNQTDPRQVERKEGEPRDGTQQGVGPEVWWETQEKPGWPKAEGQRRAGRLHGRSRG